MQMASFRFLDEETFAISGLDDFHRKAWRGRHSTFSRDLRRAARVDQTKHITMTLGPGKKIEMFKRIS